MKEREYIAVGNLARLRAMDYLATFVVASTPMEKSHLSEIQRHIDALVAALEREVSDCVETQR